MNQRFFLPAQKEAGMDPDNLVFKLQKVLFPVDALIVMSGDKLELALKSVLALKEQFAGQFEASDVRGLIKVRETQSMLLAAEMTLKATLMRKETRPNIFYREDYPETDNASWLKWITVKKGLNENMEFSFEEISFDNCKFKPSDNLDKRIEA